MKTTRFITGIAGFLAFVFLYTACSKLLTFNVTLFDMKRNPLLEHYAYFLSIAVPVTEIIVAILLIIPKSRKYGLWASLALVLSFTLYVCILLFSKMDLPCTCGGIIRELSWRQHLLVNVGLIGLNVLALFLEHRHHTQHKEFQLVQNP